MANLTDVFLKSKRSDNERLFECVSSYDIFCFFIGEEVQVGKVILSPIRKDSRPTFILFIPEDKDEVFFKDFAWMGGSVFTFVKLFALYQENINMKSHNDILRYIDQKMGIGLFEGTKIKPLVRRPLDASFYASKRVIKFKAREFTERDKEYWGNYHISEETLRFFCVRSVHKLLNENDEVVWTVSQRTLTYAYVINNKIKLYRPEEAADFKWRNTCPGHYIQGLKQMINRKSGNEYLIITKSLKDVMVFYEFLGDTYDVIAPHSETYIFTDTMLDYLYTKYKKIIIIFDFDLAGVTGANKLRKRNPDKFEVTFVSTKRIRINNKTKVIDKDISDFSVDRTREAIMERLKLIGLCK
jgi:5S rRNA maturation endonuclease (ribonuclease M5)